MSFRKISQVLVVSSVFVFCLAQGVWAGFGVSPPWVKCEHLLQGSHFEQTVNLVQSEPKEEYLAQAEFSSDLLKIKDWIKIDKGMEFVIPAGVQQFPLTIKVDVPQDAEFGVYKGYIWINGKPNKKEGVQVTTIVGATIEVALNVNDKEFSDWTLRDLGVNNLKNGESFFKVILKVENLGNIETRPSRVSLEVYDDSHREILAKGDDSDLEYILPFQTKEVIAEFPVNLETNKQYWAEIKVYKGKEVFLADKRRFNAGEIKSETGLSEESGKPKESKATLGFAFLKSKNFLFILLGIVLLVGLGFGIRQLRKSGLGFEVKLKKKESAREKKNQKKGEIP